MNNVFCICSLRKRRKQPINSNQRRMMRTIQSSGRKNISLTPLLFLCLLLLVNGCASKKSTEPQDAAAEIEALQKQEQKNKKDEQDEENRTSRKQRTDSRRSRKNSKSRKKRNGKSAPQPSVLMSSRGRPIIPFLQPRAMRRQGWPPGTVILSTDVRPPTGRPMICTA